MDKITHFLYVPFTGLGLYQGMRGSRWLKSRIIIFKQFVVPSLLAQTNQDFVLWISWRYEERSNKYVRELEKWLNHNTNLKVVFTYSGVCFWDDKYPDDVARERLINAIHGSMGELLNIMGECDTVLMTIQPSDDCYHGKMIEETQRFFKENPTMDVFGYRRGYVMDYTKLKIAEWNPTTTPPFYTIKFEREIFTNPLAHINFTGPYKSHEYVKDYLKSYYSDYNRGFIVGTHSSNISTVFDHPYTGHQYNGDNIIRILSEFGISKVKKLKTPFSIMGMIFSRLSYKTKRRLRYLAEKKRFYAIIYNILRS